MIDIDVAIYTNRYTYIMKELHIHESKDPTHSTRSVTLKYIPEWLKSPFFTSSEICKELYGKNTPGMRGKLSQKINGHVNFNDEELTKLDEIRKKIMKELKENHQILTKDKVLICKPSYKSKDGTIKKGVTINGNYYAPKEDLI